MKEPPDCPCGKPLDRVDHLAIEHTILRDGRYRPVNVAEGIDNTAGLTGEVVLQCGYCGRSLDREHRRYFYERWRELVEFQAKGEGK